MNVNQNCIPAQGLNTKRLARALETLLSSSTVRAKCAIIADQLANNGETQIFVRDIEELLDATGERR